MAYSLVQPKTANRGSQGGQYFQIGRVKSVVLGLYKGNTKELDPDYGSPSDIGKIRYELVYSPLSTSKSQQVSEPAFPLFNFIKHYPVVNEIVFIVAGPSERQNDRVSNQQYFYLPPYDVWNNPNHGAFPNMAEYAEYLKQFANLPNYSGNATSGSLPLGYTFTEKSVKSLRPFEGDTIIQARFGQSIRFGSTVPVMKDSNTWSNSGNNGDPITILLNNQGSRSLPSKFDPIVEDINKDGSGIWMTSTQEIFLEDINNFPLNSFGVSITPVSQPVTKLVTKPTSTEVTSPQQQDENSIK